jgi:hypothetical protein
MEAAARMSGIPGWLRWVSPWVALGLAIALGIVLLRPLFQDEESPAPAIALIRMSVLFNPRLRFSRISLVPFLPFRHLIGFDCSIRTRGRRIKDCKSVASPRTGKAKLVPIPVARPA